MTVSVMIKNDRPAGGKFRPLCGPVASHDRDGHATSKPLVHTTNLAPLIAPAKAGEK